MHEASFAMSILEISTSHCRNSGFKHINSISIKIGKASSILKDALIFAFDISKKDTLAENARLIVEEIPVSGICNNCKNTFTANENYVLSCPLCGSLSFKILTGRELDIVELEVE